MLRPSCPQNTEGTQEDILTALVLDPANEECIPLMAVVFPAKSRDTLLHSKQAAAARTRLADNIATITDLRKCSEKLKPLSATSRLLKGIEIKVEDPSAEQTDSSGCKEGELLALCEDKDRLVSTSAEDSALKRKQKTVESCVDRLNQDHSSLQLKKAVESSASLHVGFNSASSKGTNNGQRIIIMM